MKGNGTTMIDRLKLALAKMAPFRSLTDDALAALAGRCRFVRFDRKRQIVGEREPSSDVFFIVSGAVRVAAHSPAGKETGYGDRGSGDMFGELGAIDGGQGSATVTALTDTLVVAMPRDAFRAALSSHPSVAEAVLERLARRVRLYSQRLYELGTLDVRGRVLVELLRMAEGDVSENNTARIDPAPTRAAIASRIGARREGVSRELARLARAGLVARNEAALEITDFTRLADMVRFAHGDHRRTASPSVRDRRVLPAPESTRSGVHEGRRGESASEPSAGASRYRRTFVTPRNVVASADASGALRRESQTT